MIKAPSAIQYLAPFSREIPFSLLAALGLFDDLTTIDKFGEVAIPLKDVANDVWPDAGTYVAPTEARIHDLSSSSEDDTLLGSGAQVVRVSGLPSWTEAEVSEDIDMAGTSNAPMTIPMVFVNRAEEIQGGLNVGQIDIVARTDLTLSALIVAGERQTEQAIVAVPAGYSVALTHIYASILTAAASAKSAKISLLVATSPDVDETVFTKKWEFGLASTGTSAHEHEFTAERIYPGPTILKVSVIVDVNSVIVDAGFDAYVVKDPSLSTV